MDPTTALELCRFLHDASLMLLWGSCAYLSLLVPKAIADIVWRGMAMPFLLIALVGGLAVGNGLLALLGSLVTGRRQREADAVITKVLGATRAGVLGVSIIQYVLLASIAAVFATPVGIALAWILTNLLLDVDFTIEPVTLAAVSLSAIAITGLLGATTIIKAVSSRPARLLRELGAE